MILDSTIILSCVGIQTELTCVSGIIYLTLTSISKNSLLQIYTENNNEPLFWILAYKNTPTPPTAPKNVIFTINLCSCQYWTEFQQFSEFC